MSAPDLYCVMGHPVEHSRSPWIHARFAALTGQQGKPESYFFPAQYNNCDNHFPYTFMGLEPGTTKAQLRKCLEDWHVGDNGILDLSRAYRLRRGTGWLWGMGRIWRRRHPGRAGFSIGWPPPMPCRVWLAIVGRRLGRQRWR